MGHVSLSNRQGATGREKTANTDDNKRKQITQSEDPFDHPSYSNTEEELPKVVGDLKRVERSQQRIETMNYMRSESDHIEIDSMIDDTHVSADRILETPNIEISDVTESLDDNLESILEIRVKSSDSYMRIYEVPAENEIAENSNIEISKLLTGKDYHEEEIEMIKVSSSIIDEDDFFDSESLLEENNLNEWFSKTKSNLLTDIEDERGVELVQECKKEDKAYTCKEIDDLNDMNNDVENSNVKNKSENSDVKVSERVSKPIL